MAQFKLAVKSSALDILDEYGINYEYTFIASGNTIEISFSTRNERDRAEKLIRRVKTRKGRE